MCPFLEKTDPHGKPVKFPFSADRYKNTGCEIIELEDCYKRIDQHKSKGENSKKIYLIPPWTKNPNRWIHSTRNFHLSMVRSVKVDIRLIIEFTRQDTNETNREESRITFLLGAKAIDTSIAKNDEVSKGVIPKESASYPRGDGTCFRKRS